MNPYFPPIALLILSVLFYIDENITERPSLLTIGVYVLAAVESLLYMAVVLEKV